MHNQSEMMQECTKEGGGGVNCVIDATGKSLLVKFHNLIDHPSDILFWSSKNANSRMTAIKKKLHGIRNDIQRLPFVTMRFLDEYHGHAVPTVQIINHLQTHVKQNEATAVNSVVPTADISTATLIKELELNASDANFWRFQTFAEEKCLHALDSMYGQFSRFTGPVLTQRTLSAISDAFKTTLPKQYHSISALLNQTRYYNNT